MKMNEKFVLFLKTLNLTVDDYISAKAAADGNPAKVIVNDKEYLLLMEYVLWSRRMRKLWAESLGFKSDNDALQACQFTNGRRVRFLYSEEDCSKWIFDNALSIS